MLHLTRKVGESIMIGDDIEITITEIKGRNVKVGILSPDTTKILRKELVTKIEQENQQAQASSELFSDFFRPETD